VSWLPACQSRPRLYYPVRGSLILQRKTTSSGNWKLLHGCIYCHVLCGSAALLTVTGFVNRKCRILTLPTESTSINRLPRNLAMAVATDDEVLMRQDKLVEHVGKLLAIWRNTCWHSLLTEGVEALMPSVYCVTLQSVFWHAQPAPALSLAKYEEMCF